MKSQIINDVLTKGDGSKYTDPAQFSDIIPFYELGKEEFRTFGSSRFAGYRPDDFKSIHDIYNIIHPKDQDIVIAFSSKAILWVNSMDIDPYCLRSEVLFRAIGKNGKTYYYNRKATVNGVTRDGLITHNYAHFEDVGWMKPAAMGLYRLHGVDTSSFDLAIQEIAAFVKFFSPRELQILKLLARGFSSADIANSLKISIHTVATHRKNMLYKAEAANTPELLTLASDMGLI